MKKTLTIGVIAVLALAVLFSVGLAKRGSGAWLGVYTQELDKKMAKSLDLKVEHGALVNEVVDDSPADEAGIREDDVITGINGQAIADSDDLLDQIAKANPGDTVMVTVMRRDQKLDLRVTLENRRRSHSDRSFSWNWDAPHAPRAPKVPKIPALPDIPRIDYYNFGDRDYGYIGVQLLDISREAAAALGAENGGVLIDEVVKDSPAETAGVKPGDIIVSIDGEKVRDPGDVQEVIHDLDEGEVAKLNVVRERKPVTLDVKVELKESDYRWSRHHNWLRNSDISVDDLGFDSDEFQSEMKELQQELKDMQRDLKELHEKLD